MNRTKIYKYLLICIFVNCLIADNALLKDLVFLKVIFQVLSLLFAFILLVRNNVVNGLLYQIPLMMFGLLNYFRTESSWGLYTILLVLFSEGLNLKAIFKSMFKLLMIVLIINLITFSFQYATGGAIVTLQSTDRLRYSLGFVSPNFAAQFWSSLVFLYYFLHEGKIKIYILAIFILMSLVFYHFTDSDALIFLLIIPILDYLNKHGRFIKMRCFVARFSFVLFMTLTFVLIRVKGYWYYFLDHYFTGRLSLADAAFSEYNYTWYGQKVEMFRSLTIGKDWHFLVVDNAYAYLSIYFGIIYLILLSFVFVFNKNASNIKVQACVIMYALAALAENNILSPYMIFPVIIAFHGMRTGKCAINLIAK